LNKEKGLLGVGQRNHGGELFYISPSKATSMSDPHNKTGEEGDLDPRGKISTNSKRKSPEGKTGNVAVVKQTISRKEPSFRRRVSSGAPQSSELA